MGYFMGPRCISIRAGVNRASNDIASRPIRGGSPSKRYIFGRSLVPEWRPNTRMEKQ